MHLTTHPAAFSIQHSAFSIQHSVRMGLKWLGFCSLFEINNFAFPVCAFSFALYRSAIADICFLFLLSSAFYRKEIACAHTHTCPVSMRVLKYSLWLYENYVCCLQWSRWVIIKVVTKCWYARNILIFGDNGPRYYMLYINRYEYICKAVVCFCPSRFSIRMIS